MDKFIIKNAKLVSGEVVDILVENSIIKQVQPSISIDNIDEITIDNDCYVSAGWIDMHTHCYGKYELYSDNCDEIGYKKGVTRVVDAGTSGANDIDDFYESVKDCKTHVYSLLNISKIGLAVQNELADMNNIDVQAFVNACKKYPDFIKGVKARMSMSVLGDSGELPLFEALKIADMVNLPLMVHVGGDPARLETVLDNVRKGDIVTHILNPKTNGIVIDGGIKDCVFEAYNRGVYFDLGHGTDSFGFKTLDIANENGIKIHSISSDIYSRNRINGPVYDLATTISKLFNNGYDLSDVISRVTSAPARLLKLGNVGEIKEGYIGEFTIFKVINKDKVVVDSRKNSRIINSYIEPVAVIIRDEFIKIKE